MVELQVAFGGVASRGGSVAFDEVASFGGVASRREVAAFGGVAARRGIVALDGLSAAPARLNPLLVIIPSDRRDSLRTWTALPRRLCPRDLSTTMGRTLSRLRCGSPKKAAKTHAT